MWRNLGQIAAADIQGNKDIQKAHVIEPQCFPLYSILLALNRKTVDYFSLDVEGAELGVLKTIPFDKVNIRVLTVEFTHALGGNNNEIQTFMEAQGYKAVTMVGHPNNLANDLVFVSQNG